MGIEMVQPIGKSMPRLRERRWPTIDQIELAPKAHSAVAPSTTAPSPGTPPTTAADRAFGEP